MSRQVPQPPDGATEPSTPSSWCPTCAAAPCAARVREDTAPQNVLDLIDRMWRVVWSGHLSREAIYALAAVSLMVIAAVSIVIAGLLCLSDVGWWWCPLIGGTAAAGGGIGALRRRLKKGGTPNSEHGSVDEHDTPAARADAAGADAAAA